MHARESSVDCRVALVAQHSKGRCLPGKTFGCGVDGYSIWTRGCRGEFRCGSEAPSFFCGYPPGEVSYKCRCSVLNVAACRHAVAARQCSLPLWRASCPHACNHGVRVHDARLEQQLAPIAPPDSWPERWWRDASPGYCDAVSSGVAGDCARGVRGWWQLPEGTESSGDEDAANACLKLCLACPRCRYLSWSLEQRTCSWAHACDLDHLYSDHANSFLSVSVRALLRSSRLRPLEPLARPLSRAGWPAEHVDAPCSHEYPNTHASRRRPKQLGGAHSLLTRLLVVPRLRLAYCPIEKAGETRLIRLLFHAATGEANATFAHLVQASDKNLLPSLSGLAHAARLAVLACADFVKVVVVRDPLERLLSAYLDLCEPRADDGPARSGHREQHCEGFPLPRWRPSFDQLVDHLAALPPHERSDLNQHFLPQAYFCGLVAPRADAAASSDDLLFSHGTLPRFHHVVRLSAATFAADMLSVLASVGVAESTAHRFLQMRDGHDTGAAGRVRRYYTRESAAAARGVYSVDYSTFRLPEPAWLADLAGYTHGIR
ncbi:hypothetical protein EMIHUDRAFT_455666 [Emiliania huxleyi CCMP1516]|uniref:Sulfotransferase domain-containing protein n=2 Tax=Emiliania huxleyi TaxID=2903 RepID=A0A0D3KDZ1_EMIH1|nr:hypothetical protein EMIHUDRAFT_455666 [Emiliania huxleyi CCMP1516]EOD33976.1 hypothetical protein EMIHUDRAFT_455666 [Emiliania huxleyi CCMP1516]|eukprot:XP_005786405.1 hypothetical protein EMIHUDRAFT_455666 [Emiliania huxleyi CCMP1516]